MGMCCNHKWEIVTEKTLRSAYEQLKTEPETVDVTKKMFQKKYICILQCTKCGQLNKTVEVNPE